MSILVLHRALETNRHRFIDPTTDAVSVTFLVSKLERNTLVWNACAKLCDGFICTPCDRGVYGLGTIGLVNSRPVDRVLLKHVVATASGRRSIDVGPHQVGFARVFIRTDRILTIAFCCSQIAQFEVNGRQTQVVT